RRPSRPEGPLNARACEHMTSPEFALSGVARTLMAERPVFDAHVDSLQLALDLGADLGQRGRGHLDLARGREGGLGSVVFVCWPDAKYAQTTGASFASTSALLGAFHRLAASRGELMRWAGNGAMAREARDAGLVAGIPGIEGGHAIEDSLEKLEFFFE